MNERPALKTRHNSQEYEANWRRGSGGLTEPNVAEGSISEESGAAELTGQGRTLTTWECVEKYAVGLLLAASLWVGGYLVYRHMTIVDESVTEYDREVK